MAGNAHANRHGHIEGCSFCVVPHRRGKGLKYRNPAGHKHNPASKRSGKRSTR